MTTAEAGHDQPEQTGGPDRVEVRGRGPGSVLGLRLPADPALPVSLAVLRLTAAELSAAIGGGLLEDALYAEHAGVGYIVYLDERRAAKGLPGNDRAAVLSARLGQHGRTWLAGLRGDALFLGCDDRLDDVSVPRVVVEAAVRCGLVPADTATAPSPGPGRLW